MTTEHDSPNAISELLKTMHRIRQSCPWDQQQTSQSLAPYAIEEAYELAEALQKQDIDHIREELGDLLLQVIFQSEIQSENKQFDFYDVVHTLNEKLIRRHPHVFADLSAKTPDDVKKIWSEVKANEKATKSGIDTSLPSILDQIKAGPSLKQAIDIQKRAAQYGFDWPNAEAVWKKVEEETSELKEAIHLKDKVEMANELGDVLFSLANLARKLEIDPAEAIALTNAKFRKRFAFIEQQLAMKGKTLEQTNLAEMDQLWEAAKKLN